MHMKKKSLRIILYLAICEFRFRVASQIGKVLRGYVYRGRIGGEKAIGFFRSKLSEDPSVGILCYDEYLPFLEGEYIYSYGKKQDDLAHSHLLFDCLLSNKF